MGGVRACVHGVCRTNRMTIHRWVAETRPAVDWIEKFLGEDADGVHGWKRVEVRVVLLVLVVC